MVVVFCEDCDQVAVFLRAATRVAAFSEGSQVFSENCYHGLSPNYTENI